MSSDAASSPPPSLPLESTLHASLSDGEAPDTQSLETLREQLRCMQLRLAESECCASNLSSELGFREDNYSVTLARLQNEHVYALQTLESSLRAEAQDALDAAACELEAAASERAHLWSLLRDTAKQEGAATAHVSRRASAGNATAARVAAWATP